LIYGHLETIELILNTLSPVFIGSGRELSKKEYIFDKAEKIIHMPNLSGLISFLSERNLLTKYEEFLLQPEFNDLYVFLSKNGIAKKDYKAFVAYSIDAGEAAYSEKLRGILTFIKGADGKPYIPGSSLKGAIRTAIAAKMVKNGDFSNNIMSIEEAAKYYRGSKTYISREAQQLENRLFCTLGIKDPTNPDRIRWDSILNDFMRGISISDSQPIAFENLTLCSKYDWLADGKVNILPIYRECLAPGTRVRFVMTLDIPVLKKAGIDKKFIEDALHKFSDFHYENYEQYFSKLGEDAVVTPKEGENIILGGGSGYVSKTLLYPLIQDRKKALKLVSTIMSKQFRDHNHGKDEIYYKVSPHTLKMALYKGRYYQMGRCELIFK